MSTCDLLVDRTQLNLIDAGEFCFAAHIPAFLYTVQTENILSPDFYARYLGLNGGHPFSRTVMYAKVSRPKHHDTINIKRRFAHGGENVIPYGKIVLISRLNVFADYFHIGVAVRPTYLMPCAWK